MAGAARRLCVVLPFGWRLEAWASLSRWRLAMLGVGFYIGEPWGIFEGRLWGVALRVWSLGVGFGVRGPAPEVPAMDADDDWEDHP